MVALNLGVVGCGTVGQSMLNILRDRKDTLDAIGVFVTVSKVCVRDPSKKRSYIPEGATLVSDFNAILDDPEINVVVEMMGGTTLAKDLVYGAIAKGKHVVTANKALLAEHLPELLGLVEKHQVQLGYEAAVCGGIPIIHGLQKDFLGDAVTQIAGIMNGTTNFILSKMENEGAAYADVLKEAQDLGYAEADPTADVGGFDVRAKIGLLARLGMGTYVEAESIPTTGITSICAEDFMYAKHLRGTIKLLGMAKMAGDGSLTIYVAPHFVPQSSPIAAIGGATNIVEVQSANLGSSFFVGQGAGGDPTANSVVSDILSLAQGQLCVPFPKSAPTKLEPDYPGCFYIRFKVEDQVGIIKKIADTCWKNDVSIGSIEQAAGCDRSSLPFVVTTDRTTLSKVQAVCEEVAKENWNKEAPFFMPMIGGNP